RLLAERLRRPGGAENCNAEDHEPGQARRHCCCRHQTLLGALPASDADQDTQDPGRIAKIILRTVDVQRRPLEFQKSPDAPVRLGTASAGGRGCCAGRQSPPPCWREPGSKLRMETGAAMPGAPLGRSPDGLPASVAAARTLPR